MRVHLAVIVAVFLAGIGAVYAVATTRALVFRPELSTIADPSAGRSHPYLVATAVVSYACIPTSYFVYRRRGWAARVAAVLLVLLSVALLGIAPWMWDGIHPLDRVLAACDRILPFLFAGVFLIHPSVIRAIESEAT